MKRVLRMIRDSLIEVSLFGILACIAWTFNDLEAFRPAGKLITIPVAQIVAMTLFTATLAACSTWERLDK